MIWLASRCHFIPSCSFGIGWAISKQWDSANRLPRTKQQSSPIRLFPRPTRILRLPTQKSYQVFLSWGSIITRHRWRGTVFQPSHRTWILLVLPTTPMQSHLWLCEIDWRHDITFFSATSGHLMSCSLPTANQPLLRYTFFINTLRMFIDTRIQANQTSSQVITSMLSLSEDMASLL